MEGVDIYDLGEVIAHFRKKQYTPATSRNRIRTIIITLEGDPGVDLSEYRVYYSKLITLCNKAVIPRSPTDWHIILQAYESLKNYSSENDEFFRRYALMSIFILFAPRWASEISNMYYVFHTASDRDGRQNIYDDRNSKFTFFVKTHTSHVMQEFEISEELNNILLTYIKIFDIKPGDKLFDYSPDRKITKLSNTLFKRVVNQNIWFSDMRKSYINYYNNTKMRRLMMGAIHARDLV